MDETNIQTARARGPRTYRFYLDFVGFRGLDCAVYYARNLHVSVCEIFGPNGRKTFYAWVGPPEHIVPECCTPETGCADVAIEEAIHLYAAIVAPDGRAGGR